MKCPTCGRTHKMDCDCPSDVPNLHNTSNIQSAIDKQAKPYQPYTTDVTPTGLLAARNQFRLMFGGWPLYAQHAWLCHPGEECEDGCDVAAIPERLALINSDHEGTNERY